MKNCFLVLDAMLRVVSMAGSCRSNLGSRRVSESGVLARSDAPVVVLREIVALFVVRKVGQNELAPAKVLLINLRIPSSNFLDISGSI